MSSVSAVSVNLSELSTEYSVASVLCKSNMLYCIIYALFKLIGVSVCVCLLPG